MNDTFLTKVSAFIADNKMFKKGDSIVLGVSGGADSVALLLVCDFLKEKFELNLSVLHVNHGLREEAASEGKYVESLCRQRNIPFFLKETDVKSIAEKAGLGTEEAGRIERYKAFSELAAGMGENTKIAVAHNKNDMAETMIFNLCRGTGIKGLASIAPVRGNIIRPLLCVTRDEIEDFLFRNNVSFCTDKSNFTDDYTRNRIRNHVIPSMRENVENLAVEHMAETAGQLHDINVYLSRVTKEAFNACADILTAGEAVINIPRLLKEDFYIQSLVVKHSIDELVPQNRDITHTHIDSVLKLCGKEGSKSVNLPYGIVAVKEYDLLKLKIGDAGNTFSFEPKALKIDAVNHFDKIGTFVTKVFAKTPDFKPIENKYTKWFDYDKITKCVMLRTRKSSDYIVVNATGGTQKLKDYFINLKIPKAQRDSILCLADDNRILWVVGYRIGEDVKVTDLTRNILEITFIEEDNL